jgi:hypothetical protein
MRRTIFILTALATSLVPSVALADKADEASVRGSDVAPNEVVELVQLELLDEVPGLAALAERVEGLADRISALIWLAASESTPDQISGEDFFWDVVWPGFVDWMCSFTDCDYPDVNKAVGEDWKSVEEDYSVSGDDDGDDLWSGDGCQGAPTCSTGGSSTGTTSLSDLIGDARDDAGWEFNAEFTASFQQRLGDLLVMIEDL